jgi:DNA-binding CsgD family transcriptional regulator
VQGYDRIVGDIYDCAANPDLWPETLNRMREFIDCAYVMTAFGDFSAVPTGGRPIHNLRSSSWDQSWFQKLEKHLSTIPHVEVLYRNGIDMPWVQSDYITEEDVRKTDFYLEWVQPQKLRDCLNILFMDRKLVRGVVSFATPEGRPLLGEREREIANMICPHIRRAIAINDMVDKGNLALALYRKVLDNLAVAVCVVSTGGRVIFTNAKADALLSAGTLLRKSNGKLAAVRSDITGATLDDAIERGIKGDHDVGISGIGVPLVSLSGERAAAYVLPITGTDVRGQMGEGYAAVFIAQRGEQQPMAVEILRTVFDLTPTEARIAYATSLGDRPDVIALAHGSNVDTVRSHLKNIYVKVDVRDKTALAARVNALVPPLHVK